MGQPSKKVPKRVAKSRLTVVEHQKAVQQHQLKRRTPEDRVVAALLDAAVALFRRAETALEMAEVTLAIVEIAHLGAPPHQASAPGQGVVPETTIDELQTIVATVARTFAPTGRELRLLFAIVHALDHARGGFVATSLPELVAEFRTQGRGRLAAGVDGLDR